MQIELVGNLIPPALDLRLSGESLAPLSALVEYLRKEILIHVGFGIERRARLTNAQKDLELLYLADRVPLPGVARSIDLSTVFG